MISTLKQVNHHNIFRVKNVIFHLSTAFPLNHIYISIGSFFRSPNRKIDRCFTFKAFKRKQTKQCAHLVYISHGSNVFLLAH